ncbi:hypothetical protein [Streptomyces acidicola]|uniref:Uncharacterized protein n=1 Tax=Streptomyces acidicola TaxID=2596892 RepID=A0A5N8WRW9_9ACTN|nr:hypothetical protein [Streptomyces acidicola]MPY49556.1 hypothetical protein [Streptomyces acidicola]
MSRASSTYAGTSRFFALPMDAGTTPDPRPVFVVCLHLEAVTLDPHPDRGLDELLQYGAAGHIYCGWVPFV